MQIQISGPLLDLCVLALVAKEPLYGYRLTQKMIQVFALSESALYPVLRRLLKQGYLEVYDQPFDGRMRRYYRISKTGLEQVQEGTRSWQAFSKGVSQLLEEAKKMLPDGTDRGGKTDETQKTGKDESL